MGGGQSHVGAGGGAGLEGGGRGHGVNGFPSQTVHSRSSVGVEVSGNEDSGEAVLPLGSCAPPSAAVGR